GNASVPDDCDITALPHFMKDCEDLTVGALCFHTLLLTQFANLRQALQCFKKSGSLYRFEKQGRQQGNGSNPENMQEKQPAVVQVNPVIDEAIALLNQFHAALIQLLRSCRDAMPNNRTRFKVNGIAAFPGFVSEFHILPVERRKERI